MLHVLSLDEKSLCLLLELAWERERERESLFSLVSTGLSLMLARRKRKEKYVICNVGWLVLLLGGEGRVRNG